MVDVYTKRCSHDFCTMPRFGVLANGTATVCRQQVNDLLNNAGAVICAARKCEVAGCGKSQGGDAGRSSLTTAAITAHWRTDSALSERLAARGYLVHRSTP